MANVSLRAYNREIEAMIDRGHLDEAIAHCQHILKTFPKHLETYRLLGKAYLEAKTYNEAVDIFSRVLVAEPNDFVAQVGMSIIRDEQNKLDDAIWHMERAYEVQSANPAIMGELQRLYGRRDGVQPPRIRMTRGALAHMYMRGELYPQAISEARSVLQEDPGRSDMQVLLARAYYKSGHKNDAADAASTVLKRYPYCFDANRVLTEVLGSDRPESAGVYRKRVIELDPYAAQVNGTVFQANEVGDPAVSLENLDWNGQPVGMPSGWGTTGAIGLGTGSLSQDEQPEWLKNALPETTAPPSSQTAGLGQDAFSSSDDSPAQPADEIPDFLRAAGWGESTGTFDESKASAMFDDEPAAPAEPISQGDLPDWVKAMAPQQEEAQPTDEEEMPDWINKIGTGALPVPSDDSASDDMLSELGGESTPQSETSSGDLDWMKDLGQEGEAAPASDEQPDWLKDLGQDEQPAPTVSSDEQPDWLKDLSQEEQPASAASSDDQMDWLKGLGSDEKESASETQKTGEFDFLSESQPEPEQQAPVETPAASPSPQPSATADDSGKGGQEDIDDALAWFENLAAKQGATEGLLTKPEERREEEPDWIKQARELNEQPKAPVQQTPVEQTPVEEELPMEEPTPAVPQSSSADDLGKGEQDINDALAWFESLAAKQGATEGLLTKPEERREQEPEWVKQAKSSGAQQPPAQQAPAEQAPVEEPTPSQPSANVEDLGKSDQEVDDALAWFESLAAKQGATEGLLTKPEERHEQEPEWVKQAKSSGAQQPPAQQAPAEQAPVEEEPQMETPMPPPPPAAQEPEEATATEDVASWLRGLDEEEEEQQPAPVAEHDTTSWLRSLDEPEEEAPVTSEPVADDLPAWMQGISEEEAPAAESTVPEEEAQPVAESPTSIDESEEIPDWLGDLEKEGEQVVSESDELPAWMRDETGEVVAEPTKIEPTSPADWKPVDEKEEEPTPPPPAPKPEPKKKKSAPRKTEVKPATPPEPYKEPVTRRVTGMLSLPVDPILGSARNELSRSNIPGALETYEKLIKKGRFLEEVIYDLREALYRYPVEVSIWQTLGDAYMRANQLQDALDAYTKAEELLR